MVDYCTACDKKIEVHFDGDFNRADEEVGPFCDACWFFVKEIQQLEQRIKDLELRCVWA